MTFEYSYQECLACGNCTEIVDTERKLEFKCTARYVKQVYKSEGHKFDCSKYKPKQEPKMTEKTFDKETPGALIGKFVEVKHLGKAKVIGDKRIATNKYVGHIYVYMLTQDYFDNFKPEDISEWTEPETLEERAVYLYTTSAKQTCIADILLTKKDAEDRCKGYGHILHKWPIGDVYKFNKAGELVE